ncbi:T9SS type A sorting domain-containing protein [Flavobacterium sp. CYK-4]|uniref:T9SS type A sorting domain-containing protein n=1 Tax=Flavobacterium lotistagni TaxID=2709660 RepID=UPI00140A1DD6|nr:T9SS type A sorting domain-containing protein [Flavobacterium lotistagni]NHM06969.1 T9SS type A sorting domain-containing protein [Flavobacterium lotistagni]
MKKITFNLLLGVGLLLSSVAMNAQANDNFANAEAISCGNNFSGTTAGATLDEDNAPDGFGADMDAPNVWYSYTGSGSPETVTLNLCNSSYDTSVMVYTGTSGNLTLVIANDDDNSCGVGLTTRSRLSFNSDGSTTYYIAIEGWNATSTGAYTMDVTCDAVNPPAVENQTCLTALNLEVDGSILTSDNSYGDVTATQPTCDTFGSIQDVWFSFVAPSSTVDCTVTIGTMTSANFAIYSGACDALTSIACNANLTTPFTQSLTTLTAGETYYVQVWSGGSEQGEFNISLSDPSVCLPVATFEKVANCPSDTTFTVNVNVTSLASASSVTITDDQGSASQSLSAAGVVSFGPYAFGTSVVITVTNDQTPGCALVSPAQLLTGCPPANDECLGAIALTVNPDFSCAEVTPGTIAAASASVTDTAACGGTEDDDVWFSFVATNASHTISLLNVAGSTADLFHSVWTGADCDNLTLVPNTCSDPNNSTANGLTPGETYYLRVYSWTATVGQTSTFDVCIGTPPPPPANDDCAGAIAVNVNADAVCTEFTSGTIASATPSNTDTAACGGTEDDDVWFSFVATGTSHYINLNNVAGSTLDLYHSVWTGADCDNLTLVPNTCSDPNNSLAAGLTPGDTYYVRVYSWTATAGQTSTFDICIGTPPAPPANDECDGAIALTVNSDMGCAVFESATLASATPSNVDTAACGGTEDDDVWFSFVATDAIQAINLNNVAGSTTDLFHSVWTGDCGALTLVAGSCSDNNASVPTGLVAGQTYYIRVYSSTATAGQTSTFDICVGTPPPPPANDDCTGAIEITAGGEFATSPVVGSNVSSTTTAGLPAFSCQPNRFNDVWYTVIAPDSGTLTVETDAAPGTAMTDSVITVYRGSCGSLVEVGCDDDTGNGNFSRVVLSGLTPGETLYIGVWKWGTSSDGEFQLSAYDASLLANESFDNSSFKAFPVPVENYLNLSYSKNITNVAVFNLLGQQVIAKSLNSSMSQIDMSHLMSGTYFVKVTADNQTKTIKVVKE